MIEDHTTRLRLRLELIAVMRPARGSKEAQAAAVQVLRALTLADGAEAVALGLLLWPVIWLLVDLCRGLRGTLLVSLLVAAYVVKTAHGFAGWLRF